MNKALAYIDVVKETNDGGFEQLNKLYEVKYVNEDDALMRRSDSDWKDAFIVRKEHVAEERQKLAEQSFQNLLD
jgi:hypothetical protein